MAATETQDGWLGGISVRSKLLLAFGPLLLLLLLNGLAFFYVQNEQREARERTIHTYEVLSAIEHLLARALDQQTGLRGYQLTADRSFLEPYQKGREDFGLGLSALRGLTTDNPAQGARLDRIAEIMRDWHAAVAVPLLEASTLGAVRDRELFGRLLRKDKQSIQQVRELSAAIEQEERRLLALRLQRLESVVRLSRGLTVASVGISVALLLLGLLVVRRLITAPLVYLTGLMTRLSERDETIEVPNLGRGDEIGALARALQVFKQMVIADRRRAWVKSSSAQLSERLQKSQDRQAFAETLCAGVAPLLGAGLAVFYGSEDDEGGTLRRLGGYGFRPGAASVAAYQPGEGLVGQCARDRQPLQLDALPENYSRIHSGTGEAAPRHLILLPVLVQERLLGVLEFAAFEPFGLAQRELLDELLPIIGLSLDNLRRALRTQQLLEETQAQAEELQASEEALRNQQEQLRSSNERLREQSARLQVSEEELRVQAEELQASNEELRQRGEILSEQARVLEQLRQETQDKADELARASQYKSDFLANMSHELRTPLNSLLILSRGLADNEDGNLSTDEVESAVVIHESGSNLLRLINDILDLSKVESGKMELVLDQMPLGDLVSSLQRNFRHVAREKSLEFQVRLEPGLPAQIQTDAGKLEQILNNLLSNAFKFTASGSVQVLIGRPEAGAGREGDIAIQVIDTGIGIPPDKFDKVFQAFEQVDAGTSRHYGGTGLGLSIARGMAQLLGGDIRLDSEPGRGTRFTLLLPEHLADSRPESRQEAPRPAPAVSSAPSTPAPQARAAVISPALPDDRDSLRPGQTRILVVEDDLNFARILLDMIRRKGHQVLFAADGESGLDLARQHRPNGVLLDVMLPGMDGWTVMERLKADSATRHIPVHFISATGEASRGLELGAVGFLTKPVTREALGEAFDRLLHFAADRTRRLLVVDDDPASRRAVRQLLAADAVEISEAPSAEEALRRIQAESYDCVVLDLHLPGMDGFELLEQLAARGSVPPVVVYSGRDLSQEETLRLRQHTDSIVVKGARSPERLLDEVSLFLHSVRESPAAVPSAAGGDRTLDGRCVLLVDDDMRNIFALSKALRAKGLKVVMAQDGHKALRQLEDSAGIEIVLMDIMMPGMDGYETMRAIRADPRHARLPIIALTAKAMRGDREKCLEAGASDYLSKPIDLDRLFSMMRVWLAGV